MANPVLDLERAAEVLIDARLMGDAAAGRKHGLSERTVRRYRQRAEADLELSQAVQVKVASLPNDWLEDARALLGTALRKLSALVSEADDPDYIRTIAGAIKIVGELAIAGEVLREPSDGQQGAAISSFAPTAPAARA